MKNVTRRRFTRVTIILSFLLLLGAGHAQAQSSFNLSRSRDFSTDDRAFDRSNSLFMMISAPHVDFADLDDNEFRLKPAHGGNDIRGTFVNNFDGTYSATLPLDITDNTVSDWEWRARIKDDAGREFETRVSLHIRTAMGGDDNNGDNDNDDNGPNDEIELTGNIDEIGPDFIVVSGTTFVVDDQTDVFDNDSFPIPFSELVVAGLVEIRGELGADLALRATRIKIEDRDDDELELTGVIDEIGPDFIVVAGLFFSVTESTLILDNNNLPISFDELLIGMLVEIRGDSGAGDGFVATKIKIEDQIEDEVELTGLIEDITLDTIVVLGQTFHVPQTVLVLDDDGNTIPFSSLMIGDNVEIKGELQPGGDLVALRIKLEDNTSASLRIVAPVQSADFTSFTVLGLNVVLDDNTQITSSEATALSRLDITAGKTVEIEASKSIAGILRASHITIQNVTIISGAITLARAGTIAVEGLSFTIDDQTIILDSENRIVPGADMMGAALAEVRGVAEENGYRATKIKISGTATSTASEADASSIPDRFSLIANYPNPFNPTTTISFELMGTANGSPVELTIYDVLGRKVKTLINNGQLSAGTHQIVWDATNDGGSPVASGLYLYRLSVAGHMTTRTMTLLK